MFLTFNSYAACVAYKKDDLKSVQLFVLCTYIFIVIAVITSPA